MKMASNTETISGTGKIAEIKEQDEKHEKFVGTLSF